MSYFVYVLRSLIDGWRYVGSSENVERRLKEHNTGSVVSTRKRKPFEIVYKEEFENKKLAELRERFLKTGKGRTVLAALLKT